MIIGPLAFFSVVAVLTSLELGRITLGKGTFWRLIIPSWRFYEEVGEVVELSYRTENQDTGFGPWTSAIQVPSRGFFLNSEENLSLACKGLVGQLVCELSERRDGEEKPIEDTVAYRLVTELARQQAQASGGNFQFKVSCISPGLEPQDYLLSGVHSL